MVIICVLRVIYLDGRHRCTAIVTRALIVFNDDDDIKDKTFNYKMHVSRVYKTVHGKTVSTEALTVYETLPLNTALIPLIVAIRNVSCGAAAAVFVTIITLLLLSSRPS